MNFYVYRIFVGSAQSCVRYVFAVGCTRVQVCRPGKIVNFGITFDSDDCIAYSELMGLKEVNK